MAIEHVAIAMRDVKSLMSARIASLPFLFDLKPTSDTTNTSALGFATLPD